MKRHHRKHFLEPLPPGTKMVARPTRWGNPFSVKKYGRKKSLKKFRKFLNKNPELVAVASKELAGYDLACYCRLDQSCHADIWIEVLGVKS